VSKERVQKNWRLGKYSSAVLEGHRASVRCVAYDPTQRGKENIIMTGSDDCTIKIWDTTTKSCIHTIVASTKTISCLQFSGDIVVSGSADHGISIYHYDEMNSSDKTSATFRGHLDLITSLQYDNDKLISCSYDTTLKQWDFHTGQNIWTIHPRCSYLWHLQYIDNILMVGSSARITQMYDLRSQQCVGTFSGHKGSVYCLQFNDKTHTLITGSGDDTIKCYDSATG